MGRRRRRDIPDDRWHPDGSPPARDDLGCRPCRWCKGPLPRNRPSFCSPACIHRFREATDLRYLRRLIFRRDRGVCARCGRDCIAWWKSLLAECGLDPNSRRGRRYARRNPPPLRAALESLGTSGRRKSLWDLHHVIPRAEGGPNSLANSQTLCIICHALTTMNWHLSRRPGA